MTTDFGSGTTTSCPSAPDTNGDGNFDQEWINESGNLFSETVHVDLNEDGVFDVTYHDTDGDGLADIPA